MLAASETRNDTRKHDKTSGELRLANSICHLIRFTVHVKDEC